MFLFINNLDKGKKFIIIFTIFLLSFFILASGVTAQTPKDTDYGLNPTLQSSGLPTSAKENTNLPIIIGKIIGAGLAFIGIAFFILIIYGGFLWMFARGNEQQVAKAKDLIISAVIGLIIVLAAYAITRYIGSIFGQVSTSG